MAGELDFVAPDRDAWDATGGGGAMDAATGGGGAMDAATGGGGAMDAATGGGGAKDAATALGITEDAATGEATLAEFISERRRPSGNVSRVVCGLLLGLLIGAIGTTIHRTIASGVPLGLLMGLLLTVAAALLLRAWGGLPALLSYALGWVIAMEALSLYGPGGDIIVLDPRANVPIPQAGIIWNYLGIALLVAALLLPKRWFQRIDDDDDEMPVTSDLPG